MYFPHSPSSRAPSQALFISALIIFSRLSRRDSRNVYVHRNNTAPSICARDEILGLFLCKARPLVRHCGARAAQRTTVINQRLNFWQGTAPARARPRLSRLPV